MSSATPAVDQASITSGGTGGVVADSNSLYAGIARSGIRALALYFSRPIRLFRPSKASGWTTLRFAAQRDGVALSPQYISQYVKQHGLGVLPRHFVPPLLINTVLGTLLFTSYTTMSSELLVSYPTTSSTLIAAVSGASAGAIQAIAGAPAENVRLLMENGSFHAQTSVSGWRHAWKEVFVDASQPIASKDTRPVRMRLSDAREARIFANELREMAGRGWNGWGWGLAKDVCGYGLFFAIFDVSRKAAIHTSHVVESTVSGRHWTLRSILNEEDFEHTKSNNRAPTSARVAQGTVLVTGGVIAGVAYEFVGRPFDAVRREWHIYAVSHPLPPTPSISGAPASPPSAPVSASSSASTPPKSTSVTSHAHPLTRPRAIPPLLTLIHDIYASGGIRAFFPSNTSHASSSTTTRGWQARVYPVLRMLGRVGPWGAGFLVWEAFGPGIQ